MLQINDRVLPDIQSRPDKRNIAINKVGIKDIRFPIAVKERDNGLQHTVGDINMYVSLPKEFKGTHLSRFVAILNQFEGEIEPANIETILATMREKLTAAEAHFEVTFPYFLTKEAPVSRIKSLMEYKCGFSAMQGPDGNTDLITMVEVPVTTLCPCSKEISDYGAHNQRSFVTIKIRSNALVWLEDLISIAEQSGSCEVYSLIKRVDEKYVTERAYENPKFVEDVVRDLTQVLLDDPRIDWFTVESDNDESIHNHNAYAFIEMDKRPQAQ
ncbi:MAG: GTP cyclohydrolase I FolE2 [Chloroflexi bacterium]|uniref:GTP cyclohydrolase FolE2 n=1 Tax=Candidatus Chlorohelix allophototropha TaxID=3003348 RepID=A0A8T7LT17_9CHLR|nr:GTP cyclohydrolase I FolE2 [Chloroflexota bacterium]WJW67044.1 GTP cyclohydrolase FolE2 [Chloroflexota bacterium L227-S17]